MLAVLVGGWVRSAAQLRCCAGARDVPDEDCMCAGGRVGELIRAWVSSLKCQQCYFLRVAWEQQRALCSSSSCGVVRAHEVHVVQER